MLENRSVPIIVKDKNHGHPDAKLLVAAGTLLGESMYIAAEIDSENEYVKMHIKDGFCPVLELHPDSPDDVLEYAKSESNARHKGAGFTLLDRGVSFQDAA